TSKEIKKIIEKESGKVYTLRHIQRLLHKMGFNLITPRTNHIRHDEKASVLRCLIFEHKVKV
ncbi:MAG: winged helix-turn-helix domain-containing protein, partial [Nanoarchaeota archaeon]|nr:winged helix-turn-helix domain-containing protein [Nanoarchaeota archaeon]MBU1321096.1 winged helix-turn-helix domain-containing protein [Nanoarchaeota archaeon]MBU1597305.1 winged helix-turn-helix domain-containing protein [Nanoarchaeota archaeon]MBU2441144.1 winged helix-turn-helix domain-containing protein [Nanoarchaeota archaeon]